MENETTVTEFILLGLSSDPQLQILLFFLFLVVYLITLVWNTVIMVVIRADSQLHTPMYFFLSHLSFVDICYSSAVVPKMLVNLLAKHKTISINDCFTQMFFICLSGTCEIFILSLMAYDRYAAICHPLHYVEIMKIKVCRQLVSVSWTVGLMDSLVNVVPGFKLHFCGSNEIRHFNCELPPLLALSCTKTLANKIALLSSAVVFGVSTSLLILVSYIHIIAALLRIRSAEKRHKAFSTCSSHLTVVCLFYATALFQCMKSNSISSVILDQVFSIQYTILTHMLNPIIYSLVEPQLKSGIVPSMQKPIKIPGVKV